MLSLTPGLTDWKTDSFTNIILKKSRFIIDILQQVYINRALRSTFSFLEYLNDQNSIYYDVEWVRYWTDIDIQIDNVWL